MNDAPLSQARFQALLEAYGARPEYWPEHERNAAIELLETSASARILAHEEQGVDDWLTLLTAPMLPTKLIERLNAIPEERGTVLLARHLGIRALWVPALGWAAAATVGMWFGAHCTTADRTTVKSAAIEQSAAPNENERLALSGGMLDELEEP